MRAPQRAGSHDGDSHELPLRRDLIPHTEPKLRPAGGQRSGVCAVAKGKARALTLSGRG
jgi:hypothetical protein